jgi:hypothetical protein
MFIPLKMVLIGIDPYPSHALLDLDLVPRTIEDLIRSGRGASVVLTAFFTR